MKLYKGLEIELAVTDLAFGGKGIAKVWCHLKSNEISDHPTENHKAFTIFIDGALPGQQILAKISVKKRRHAEAKLLKVLQLSDLEVSNDFQPTPGAPWMRLPIETQQAFKQKQVFELFKKFAETDIQPVFDAYISAPDVWFYRNKMDYSFGPTHETQLEDGSWQHEGFGLGSKKRGQFWLVESLEKPSGLFDPDFEALLPKFRTWCEAQVPSVYNSRSSEGFWRQLVVKKSFHENAFLLNIITNLPPENESQLASLLTEFWEQNLPGRLQGLYWTQSDDVGNANDKYRKRAFLCGTEKLLEVLQIENTALDFEISIDSFFQTNVTSAQRLYAKAASYVEGSDEILELFAGTGTISQVLAKQHPQSRITSVEIVESAVKDAQKNATRNQVNNVDFVCADVNAFMKQYTSNPPTVVLDPPRAGISPKALQRLIDFAPQELVYISCNPATLARDTNTLQIGGFNLKQISLVDQFPHTAHVEVIARFAKH